MSREHAHAYEAGYRDGSIHYELEHCPACKNVADLQEALTENAKLRELCADMWHVMWACAEQRCKHRENECYVVNGNNGALPSHDECWYERRMRELGVEVDE